MLKFFKSKFKSNLEEDEKILKNSQTPYKLRMAATLRSSHLYIIEVIINKKWLININFYRKILQC